jgi:hypothetical protein
MGDQTVETVTDEITGLKVPLLTRRRGIGVLLGGPAAWAAWKAVNGDGIAAASTTTPWVQGGNTIATTGADFIGTNNVAPIIFKTKGSSTQSVSEKARITPAGLLGVGITNPTARVHVVTGLTQALVSQTNTAGSGAAGIVGKVASTKATGDSAGVLGTNAVTGSAGAGVKGTHAGGGSGVTGTSAGNGYGTNGAGGYCGAYGSGGSYGGIFYGNNTGAYGVYGSGSSTGLYGSGGTYGVQGYGPTAVYGSGSTGVSGVGSTAGVQGNGSGSAPGVRGDSASYRGVAGYGPNSGLFGSSAYVGTWSTSSGSGGYGVYAEATATTSQNYGVFGKSSSSAGFAGYFQGNVAVAGTLSKSGGSFKIDHPLDPDGKYLSHSFVESPDMMNVYNGNVVLDGNGEATVDLPDYFEALNQDFRYQLTPIGGPAQLYVKREVEGNRFEIAGGTAGLKVSWQVTGVRHDAWAEANRIVVEEPKSKSERGKRLHVAKGSGHTPVHVGPSAAVSSASPKLPVPTDGLRPRRPAD